MAKPVGPLNGEVVKSFNLSTNVPIHVSIGELTNESEERVIDRLDRGKPRAVKW